MNRRNKRTSWLQYEVYLDAMENSPALSSGRLSRHEDLVRWKSLAGDLNKCRSGPHLSAEEWRKRLNDWKSTTRCKYRKSLQSNDITMTEIETRALRVFGAMPNAERDYTVWKEETEEVVEEEQEEEETEEELVEEDLTDAENEIFLEDNIQRPNKIETTYRTILLEDDDAPAVEYITTTTDTNGHQQAAKRIRLPSGNASVIYDVERTPYITTELSDPIPNFAQQIEQQLKRISDIQYESLQFKIARFKFNNPGFEYEPSEE
ncbi:uncharacterized protein [Drosophila tropicalis]|uniref:uncharacterized protein n=1 Tax=Drosophila tropicalis TaxID=46794 RepID=UPI0035AC2441